MYWHLNWRFILRSNLIFNSILGVVATVDESNNNHEFSVSRCDYGSLKEMPKAVLNLIKNKTYMCISIGAALDAFLLAGNGNIHANAFLLAGVGFIICFGPYPDLSGHKIAFQK